MEFFEGSMTAGEYLANRDAIFRPAVCAGDNNGTYAPPCLEIGGVQVYAYVRDGILVVSLHYDTADISEDGPFAVYGQAQIPTVITTASEAVPVWTALPDDASSPDDARQIRKASSGDPGEWPVWVLPEWVYGE